MHDLEQTPHHFQLLPFGYKMRSWNSVSGWLLRLEVSPGGMSASVGDGRMLSSLLVLEPGKGKVATWVDDPLFLFLNLNIKKKYDWI